MFLDFYHLGEQPFGVTPDPRFLYLGPGHREALASLAYGIRAYRGFDALIAPAGMGKTSLLFRLLEHLGRATRSALVFQTQCDRREFLNYLMADLGLDSSDGDIVRMHARLNEYLVRNVEEGKQFVLIVDEAQNLSNEVLETIRLLSDFETPRRKLMHIILAGQPQLGEKLSQPNLVQLRQRISHVSRLRPLMPEQVRHYIDYRLQVATYRGGRLFTPEALELIAQHSEGIPRNINNICFGALSCGFASRMKMIDAGVIREVAAERDLSIKETVAASVPSPAAKSQETISDSAPPPNVALPSLVLSQPTAMSASLRRFAAIAVGAAAAVIFLAGGLAHFPKPLRQFWKSPIPPQPSLSMAAPSAGIYDSSAPSTSSPLMTSPVTPRPALQATREPAGQAGISVGARETSSDVRTIVVKPQQTLSGISQAFLGQSNRNTIGAIVRINPKIANPDHIEVGQRLRLPDSVGAPATQPATSEKQESLTVNIGRQP
jgi:general secretion pathway protein A